MRTCIFANGEIKDYEFTKSYVSLAELFICCDGGLRHADALSIRPDYLLGDFDSVDPGLFLRYRSMAGVEVFSYPPEKDYTDLELAMDFAIERNATEIFILGGMGSRFDHTMANAALLVAAMNRNVTALMADEKNIVRVFKDKISLTGSEKEFLSLLPVTKRVTGIRTEGLKYPLKGETLKLGDTRGVSNEFLGSRAAVTIETGILFAIQSRD